MKPKDFLKVTFFQSASCVILTQLTVTSIPQLAFAEKRDFPAATKHTPTQILAQFSEPPSNNGQQERSQLVQTANDLFSKGDLTGAEENLRKLIKKFPKYPFGYYQLGNVLFRQERKEDAIQEYQKAISLNSNYALAYNALGRVFASQQRWEEAITAYQKALAINPEYGDALTNLAQVLWQKGNRAEAIASLEKALKIFQVQDKPEQVRRIEQILKEMKSGDDPSIS